MYKVSIIMCTHNGENRIVKSIESCISQTLSDVEIIIVDDASTDGTLSLLKKYEASYTNIVVIHLNKNLKLGASRNIGIRKASGDYIMFLDDDDWLETNACEKLYEAGNGFDMCGADIFYNYENSEILHKNDYNTIINCSDTERYNYMLSNGIVTTRIYKRSFLLNNNITFAEGIIYEDMYFNTLCGLYFNSCIKVDGAYYHYLQREDSISHIKNNVSQYDRITVMQEIYDETKKRELYTKYEKIINYKYVSVMASNILYICLGAFDKVDLSKLKLIRHLLKTNISNIYIYICYKILHCVFL